jgi:archaellum biogenesis ATPase FlaH
MDTLRIAKFYASRSWQIFPCKPHDKTPLVKWADVATTDVNMIIGWWEVHPDANIGLACGARSGIVVLDVDPAHGGNDSLRALVSIHGELPVTPIAKTGGGGRHYLFAHPGIEIRNSAGLLGVGLDIRGDGGYIVAPGSVHPNGNMYTWEPDYLPSKTPLAAMPEWMIALLHTKQTEKTQHISPSGEDSVYIQGGRNQALTSLAGTMRRRGMGEASILAGLLVENAARCFPPLDDAEVAQISKSVIRYNPSAPPVQNFIAVREPVSATDGLLDLSISLDNPVRFLQTGIVGLDKRLGGLPLQNLIVVAARPSIGKTTLCWQIARNVAVMGGRVLFLSLEMTMLSLWRKAAFGLAEINYSDYQNGLVSDAVKTRLQTEIIPELIDRYHYNLLGYDEQIDTAGVLRLAKAHSPSLVVIDHLSYLADYRGKDNDVSHLGTLTRNLKNIAKETNSAVVVIHHLNRAIDGREKREPQMSDLRDSGRIEANADVILMPFRQDYYDIQEQAKRYSETRIRCVKNREGERGFDVGVYYDMLHQWFYAKSELPGGAVL